MSPLLYNNTRVLYFTFEELQFVIVSSVDILSTENLYILTDVA